MNKGLFPDSNPDARPLNTYTPPTLTDRLVKALLHLRTLALANGVTLSDAQEEEFARLWMQEAAISPLYTRRPRYPGTEFTMRFIWRLQG